MKYCPNCNIKIEGTHEHCPLCQNELHGEASAAVYPNGDALRKQSLIYKIQLFALISIMLISVAAEYLLDVTCSFHWSLLVVTWVIGGELWINQLIKKHSIPSKVITTCGWWVALLVFFTFLVIGSSLLYLTWILPGVIVVCEILHFVFMMLDKNKNAMIYLLGCSVLCIAMGIFLIVYMHEKNILWVACILLGVISIIGAVIFKGRSVTGELEKRFHI